MRADLPGVSRHVPLSETTMQQGSKRVISPTRYMLRPFGACSMGQEVDEPCIRAERGTPALPGMCRAHVAHAACKPTMQQGMRGTTALPDLRVHSSWQLVSYSPLASANPVCLLMALGVMRHGGERIFTTASGKTCAAAPAARGCRQPCLPATGFDNHAAGNKEGLQLCQVHV